MLKRMRAVAWAALATLLIGVAATGCRAPASDPPASSPRIAVANSYLAAAVREFVGDDVPLLALAEPGSCPGHFDIRPGQVSALADCRLLLRFTFQRGLERRLKPLMDKGLSVIAVELPGGMCVPDTYQAACEQVAKGLVAVGLVDEATAAKRLAAVDARLALLGDDVRSAAQDAGFVGRAVVASGHQAEFCRFLRMDVVATISGADAASVSEINAALATGESIALVVANRPEGRRLADALAERLATRVVVFDNFPTAADGTRPTFDALVRANVQQLSGDSPS